MPKKHYNTVQEAKLKIVSDENARFVSNKAVLRAQIEEQIKIELMSLAMARSRAANDALKLGVTRTDVGRALGTANWKSIQDILDLTAQNYSVQEVLDAPRYRMTDEVTDQGLSIAEVTLVGEDFDNFIAKYSPHKNADPEKVNANTTRIVFYPNSGGGRWRAPDLQDGLEDNGGQNWYYNAANKYVFMHPDEALEALGPGNDYAEGVIKPYTGYQPTNLPPAAPKAGQVATDEPQAPRDPKAADPNSDYKDMGEDASREIIVDEFEDSHDDEQPFS